jgi:2-C-methyl-D-erythritol 4-phosphate cytidylyltransferase
MPPAVKCWAAIPAAGIGTRFGADRPKQYLPLRGRTLLEHALRPFLDHPGIAAVVVALAPGDRWWATLPAALRGRVQVTAGGVERPHSVLGCLRHLLRTGGPEDWVLVHDAARPCLRRTDLDVLIAQAGAHPVGGILAVPVRDTLKRAGAGAEIAATVDRSQLWHALTPQMFRLGALEAALTAAVAAGRTVTDESQAMEMVGARGMLVRGHVDNIKVTQVDDLAMAELLLARAEEGA